MFHNFSDVYIMYRAEVPNVPGEVGAAELMDALWQHLEYEDVGQEEEEAASDEESFGGSSNMDEEEVEVEHHEEDHEEEHVEDHEEDGHVRRAKRITRERINVGEKMNDYDYR